MNPWPDLRPILHGIKWVIVGGVATRAYMPERMTKDLDVLVHESDKDAVLLKLQQAGYQVLKPLAIPGYALLAPDGVEVDLLLSTEAWLKDALNEPNLDMAGYPVISLPYLILLKMGAQRTQDWADVSRMLGLASDEDLDKVHAAVARFTPNDSEDLKSLIFIGKQENKT